MKAKHSIRFRWERKGALVSLLSAANVSFSLVMAGADPATLLQQGKYREAQAGFEAIAERQPSDPRWRYNAGVAAYKAGDPTTAQKYFEAATAAADLGLQQKAWYNLGNAWFEKATAPEGENQEESLQKAKEAFGAAVQLNPTDRAANENLAAVKKFEEELKKQQQQQQQDGKSDSKKSKDQKDQKDQKGKQGKQDKNQKQDSEDNSQDQADSKSGDEQKDPSSKKDQAGKQKGASDKKEEQDSSPDGQKDKEDPANKDVAKQQGTNAPAGGSRTNQTSQAKNGDKKEGDKSGIQRGEGSEPPGAEGQTAQAIQEGERMTVVQAQQMLDAQKGSEKPIWTLIRGWGQESQSPSSSALRKKIW